MPNELPIPEDLNHLIEKREQEERREQQEPPTDATDRRSGKERRIDNRCKSDDTE